MTLRVSWPGPVPRLVCLGGGRPGPVYPLPGLGLCSPCGVGLGISGVPAPGVGRGGGGLCVVLPDCAAGGALWGGGLLCLIPSLCLPWAGNKADVLGFALAMEGVASIQLRFVVTCYLWARSVWRPCA